MNSTRTSGLIALFAVALGNLLVPFSASSAEADRVPSRQFNLVNATLDSVIALAISPAGGDLLHEIAIGRPLQGGLTSMTFDVPAGGCLRDLHLTFHGGRTQLFPMIDVCHASGLRLTRHSATTKHSRD